MDLNKLIAIFGIYIGLLGVVLAIKFYNYGFESRWNRCEAAFPHSGVMLTSERCVNVKTLPLCYFNDENILRIKAELEGDFSGVGAEWSSEHCQYTSIPQAIDTIFYGLSSCPQDNVYWKDHKNISLDYSMGWK